MASNHLLSVLTAMGQTPHSIFALRRSGQAWRKAPHLDCGCCIVPGLSVGRLPPVSSTQRVSHLPGQKSFGSRNLRKLSFQDGTFGNCSIPKEPPQFDQQLSCQGDDADLPRARSAATEPFGEPPTQLASGLVSQPTPRHLDGDCADMPVSGLADPLFVVSIPALVGCRHKPRGGAHFPPVPELPPAEEFLHTHPGPVFSDCPQAQQLSHLLDGLAAIVFDRPRSLALQLQDLDVQELSMLPFPLQPHHVQFCCLRSARQRLIALPY